LDVTHAGTLFGLVGTLITGSPAQLADPGHLSTDARILFAALIA
jgi:Co/Zn/Cd efflux system component